MDEDDFSTGSATNVPAEGDLVEGDITDESLVADLVADRDTIVHMAAMMGVRRTLENPLGVLQVNMEGTRTLLHAAAAADVGRVLFASTSEVYGDLTETPYREDAEMSPKTNYAVAKLADERYTRAFCESVGMEYTIVRYFNVYGPHQKSSAYGYVVPRFIRLAREGAVLPVHGDGTQTRDFTYIDDAVRATARALGAPGANETFNIGTGLEVSIADLARTVVDVVGSGTVSFVEHPRPYLVKRRCADVSRCTTKLGYTPRIDLETGVRRLDAAMAAMADEAYPVPQNQSGD